MMLVDVMAATLLDVLREGAVIGCMVAVVVAAVAGLCAAVRGWVE